MADRVDGAGTRRALIRRVSAVAIIASIGHSGCLADRPVLPPDADNTPFMTTTIIEEPGRTYPLPGQVIIIDPVATRTEDPKVHVTFARGDSQPLTVRWFINRPRPCVSNCGVPHFQTVPAPIDAESMPINYRETEIVLTGDFLQAGSCYRLDMYVSAQLRSDVDTFASEPVNPWDIAHARWIYIVRGIDGTLPPVSDCAGPSS